MMVVQISQLHSHTLIFCQQLPGRATMSAELGTEAVISLVTAIVVT